MLKRIADFSERFYHTYRRRQQRKARQQYKPRNLRYEVLEPKEMLSAAPLGNETLLNSYVSGTQRLYDSGNAVAAAPDGGAWVVFSSDGQDGSGYGVYGQRLGPTGQPAGNPFLVNTTTQGDQRRASVSVGSDGSAVVVWERPDGDQTGIYGQRFAPDGTPVGSQFQISLTTADAQELPSVAHLADNSWVAVWSGRGQGDISGVLARRYDAWGIPPRASSRQYLHRVPADLRQRGGLAEWGVAGNLGKSWWT